MMGESPFVGLACQGCGDNLIPHKEMPGFWFCPSCGRSYAKDNRGNLFQIEISGRVETFVGNTERERHAENAKQFIKLKEYQRAESEFEYLIENFPDDYRGWLGGFMVFSDQYLSGKSYGVPGQKRLENALRLNRAETLNCLDHFFKMYGAHIRLADDERTEMDLTFNPLKARTIDDFTRRLLFEDLSFYLELEHRPLTAFLYHLSSEYYDLVTVGKILPAYPDKLPQNLNRPALITCEQITAESNELISLLTSFGCTAKIEKQSYHSRIIITSPFNTKKVINLSSDQSTHSFTLFGKWLYLKEKGMYILLPRALTQSEVWRFGGRCPVCGSSFKGVFRKVCSNPHCGRPKAP